MALELGSLIAGGVIGFASSIGSIVFAHYFTNRRETKSRKIQGLRDVIAEAERRRRLALEIAQYVNLALRKKSPEQFAQDAFDTPGWKEATHSLQERTWMNLCLAFLPEAVQDFEDADNLIARVMSPEEDQNVIATQFNASIRSIETKAKNRLQEIL